MDSPAIVVHPRQFVTATKEQLLGFLIGYAHLLTACCEARGQNGSSRRVVVECQRLLHIGISGDVLQWMLYQSHVDLFEEDREGGEQPDWTIRRSAVVGARSALALTPLRELFAELLIGALLVPRDSEELEWGLGLLQVGALTPSYDKDNRVFAWGRHALKSYSQPAGNQETVLLAAEELGWASWFDDPLPRGRGGNPKVRLHDTIKNLKRHQSPYLVRFLGDGTGTRVGWELR
jgi:hypothetical protein